MNVRSARLEDNNSKLSDDDCNKQKFRKINRFKRLRKTNLISRDQPKQYQLCLGFNIGLDCGNGSFFDDKPLYSKTFSKKDVASINPFCMRDSIVSSKSKCPKQCKSFTKGGNSWCSPSCPAGSKCVDGGDDGGKGVAETKFEITCSNCNLSLQGTILYEAYARITGGWTPHEGCVWGVCVTVYTPWVGFEYAIGFG